MCSETAPPGWFLAKCSIPGEEGWLDEGFEVPPFPGEGAGEDVNFGLSVAAVSGEGRARRWVDDGCLLILLFPWGPRLSHGWLAALRGMPPASEGTNNKLRPCDSRVERLHGQHPQTFATCYGLGVCTGMGGTYGAVGSVAVIWVGARYLSAGSSCQAVLHNTQPRKSREGWRSRGCISNTKILGSVSKAGATTHLIILCDCTQTY